MFASRLLGFRADVPLHQELHRVREVFRLCPLRVRVVIGLCGGEVELTRVTPERSRLVVEADMWNLPIRVPHELLGEIFDFLRGLRLGHDVVPFDRVQRLFRTAVPLLSNLFRELRSDGMVQFVAPILRKIGHTTVYFAVAFRLTLIHNFVVLPDTCHAEGRIRICRV